MVPSVRQVVREVDRNKPLSYIRTVEQTLEQHALMLYIARIP